MGTPSGVFPIIAVIVIEFTFPPTPAVSRIVMFNDAECSPGTEHKGGPHATAVMGLGRIDTEMFAWLGVGPVGDEQAAKHSEVARTAHTAGRPMRQMFSRNVHATKPDRGRWVPCSASVAAGRRRLWKTP